MKTIVWPIQRAFSVLLFTGFLISCEQNLDICLERKPIPVIYSVFNKFDSINYLYITKTWSGDNGGSLATAKNLDSIYFKNVSVKIDLIRNSESAPPSKGDTVHVVPDFEWKHDKKPGIFKYPDCPVFALHYNLKDYDVLISHVSIPGYDTIVLIFNLLPKPVFYSPDKDGMAIAVLPNRSLTVRYSAITLTEVRFFLEIITKSEESFYSDTVMIRKFNFGSPVTLTYGNFLSALNLQLKNYSNIEYRQFGKVKMEIWSCAGNFPGLIPEEESFAFIDFTLPGSPWVPAYFIFGGTIATNNLINLELDYPTKEYIARDSSISKFKFIKW